MIWGALILVIIIFLVLTDFKIQAIDSRNKSEKLTAVVIEYREEKSLWKNHDNTLLNYPYVRLEIEKDHFQQVRLKYANNLIKPFTIGQKVNVYWVAGELLYWDAYDQGLFRLLPEKWNIFS